MQAENEREENQIVQIRVCQLRTFKKHPFKVRDDEKMQELVDSIRERGIVTPVVVRPADNGEYELISGHRRTHAAGILGLETVPAIVREMTDDEAVEAMVDANLQREEILPSEKAFAYKMKLEAIDRAKGRPKNEGQVVPEYKGMKSTEIVAEDTGESYKQVQRYIRLTELIPDLLDLVDQKKLKLNPAVELSYLSMGEQVTLMDAIDDTDLIPTLSQARMIRKLKEEGKIELKNVKQILLGEIVSGETTPRKKEPEKMDPGKYISLDELRQYFPPEVTDEEIRKTVLYMAEFMMERRKKTKQGEA